MRVFAFSALLAIGLGSAAVASEPVPQARTADAASAPRSVFICGTDAATRRDFEAQYGAPPVFITARDAARAVADGERWEAPRCMTQAEHDRYVRLRSERAALR